MSGITIVYSAIAANGAVNSVPTLGTAATLGLSILAAAAGAWGLKGRSTGRRMLAVGLCSSVLVALFCSGLAASAWADVRDSFSSATGGVLNYDDTVNTADTWSGLGSTPSSFALCGKTSGALTNVTGVNLTINSVDLNLPSGGYSVHTNDADYTADYTGSAAPRCTAGSTTLQPGQSCQVILVTNVC